MNRISAAIGSVIFFLVAPCMVAGVVPWWISGWRVQTTVAGHLPLIIVGVLVAVAGFALLVDSFVRFATEGLGTPAPVAPTQRLVVSGAYRFVRNPMYVGVLGLVFGQAILFASLPLAFSACWSGSRSTSSSFSTRSRRCGGPTARHTACSRPGCRAGFRG